MMTEALKTEVFEFAKSVRVNKTKLMEMVERVVSMVEAQKQTRSVDRKAEAVAELSALFGSTPFSVKQVTVDVVDKSYLLRKLEEQGLVRKVGKMEKQGRGRKDYLWMLTNTETTE